MSIHTIETQVSVKFRFPGLAEGETETAFPTLAITFEYRPGRPAYTPRGEYAPIDPPEPEEVDFVSAHMLDDDGMSPGQEQINEWAQDWLASDEGYTAACACAEGGRAQGDPDEAYERKRDDGPSEMQEWHDYDSDC